jgi:hypothetical protein
MKKVLYILTCTLLFSACENFYLNNQLGFEPTIEDVRNFAYTLTEADYASIASNPTNIATTLAMGKYENDSSIYTRLQNLKTTKYFADTLIAPELFIPAFMTAKYPHLSEGTICEVTYRITADMPIYFGEFQVIRDFNPSTPLTSVDEIIPALDAQVNDRMKKEGYKYIVNFSDDITYIYQYTDSAFSLFQSEMIRAIALSNTDYATMGTTKITDPQTTINIYLLNRFPYASTDTKYGIVYKNDKGTNTFSEFSYDGSKWIMLSSITNETMSFEVKDAWKANTSTYLSEPFIGHGQGNFIIQNVTLQDPLTYVWYYSSSYGMCASAFKDNASWDSEAWLVSPIIKLKKARNPQLIFDQAFNKASNFTEEATVLVSTDYKGDVTTCTWEALEWNKYEDGTLNIPPGTSWVFQTTGNLDLSKYKGQSIYLGFRYTTSGGISGTWEIKNLLVYEPSTEE